jgi:hypothetical protein
MNDNNDFLKSDFYKQYGWKAYLPFYADKYDNGNGYGDYKIRINKKDLSINFSVTRQIPKAHAKIVTLTGEFDCWGKGGDGKWNTGFALWSLHHSAQKANPQDYEKWVEALAKESIAQKKAEIEKAKNTLFGVPPEAKIAEKLLNSKMIGVEGVPLYARAVIQILDPVYIAQPKFQ